MSVALLVYVSISAVSLALAWRLLRRAAARPVKVVSEGTTRIRVRGRYEPDVVVAPAGRPLRLVFRREDTLACSERVVFPEFGRSAMLPPHEDVTVELLPERAGEFEFTCQHGLLRGRLVVTDAGDLRAPPSQDLHAVRTHSVGR